MSDKSTLESLVEQFMAGTLPNEIEVRRMPVVENWEGKLVLDKEHPSLHTVREPESTEEELKQMGVTKTDIPMQEIRARGKKVLAGFDLNMSILIVGYLGDL